MKILILIMLVSTLFANKVDTLVMELNKLNSNQLKVLVKTFKKADQFDLSLTMTAIAWQESQFGEVPINLSDPSCGAFHNLLSSVANRHNIILTSYNKNILCMKLINKFDFAFSESLNELLFWQTRYEGHRKSWSKMVSSYNAGYNYSNGANYLKNIRLKVKALKKFFIGRDNANHKI